VDNGTFVRFRRVHVTLTPAAVANVALNGYGVRECHVDHHRIVGRQLPQVRKSGDLVLRAAQAVKAVTELGRVLDDL
jgi:hypothetical protein